MATKKKVTDPSHGIQVATSTGKKRMLKCVCGSGAFYKTTSSTVKENECVKCGEILNY